MSFNKRLLPIPSRRVWLSIAMFAVLTLVFGLYAYWEKRIDRANDLRHTSFLLADELRQSSDDLTWMARTFVVTGDPRYKKYYQDILDIRDGKKSRPKMYHHAYWDMVVANALPPQTDDGQAIALLELMRRSEFTSAELGKLAEAKANSDGLTAMEFTAMKLAESIGPDAGANRAKARVMLYSEQYHQAKAAIMRPINEFLVLMDRRTLDSVRHAEDIAFRFRMLFIATTLVAIFMLSRAYARLLATLGGSADEVHAQIIRIGQGDFSSTITVAPGMENTVLAGLSEMQDKLHDSEIARKQSEAFKQVILNSVAAEICVLDRDGVILAVNEPWRRFAMENSIESGKPAAGTDVGANYLAACNAANGAIDIRSGIQSVLDGRLPNFILEYPCHSPQQQRWFAMSVTPLGEAAHSGVVITHTNITERKQSELKLIEVLAETRRLREALDYVPAYIYMKDPQSRYVYASRPTLELFGCSAEELVGCDDTRFFPPGTVKRLREIDQRVFQGEQTDEEIDVPVATGGRRVYWELKTPIYADAEKEKIWGLLGISMDITKRKQTEQALAESENRFSIFMDTLPAAAFIKDEDGTTLYANRYMSDVIGARAWHGKTTRDLFPPELAEKMIADDRRSLEEGYAVTEEQVPGTDGQKRVYQTHKFRIPRQGQSPLLGGISVDITERKQLEDRIFNLAYFDPLTNLPNRRMLLDRLAHALSQARRYQRSLAIMFLDLDNFKKINDTLGHDVGDELLKEVAVRLNACIRTGDTLSRQGGDEFIIVLSEITHSDDAAFVADKIIEAINVPVQIADNTLNISTSIGIAVYPINGSDDSQELMKKADMAMYAAKKAGRNGYKFFVD